MTLSFTCRLVLTRLLIRLMRSLPWNSVYRTFVRGYLRMTSNLMMTTFQSKYWQPYRRWHWRCSCHCGKNFRDKGVILSWISRNRSTCKSKFFYLYNIRRIRKYLSQEFARSLLRAFIIGRIHYCNSLLFGLRPKNMTPQCVDSVADDQFYRFGPFL